MLVRNADRKSTLMTEESNFYTSTGEEFASHAMLYWSFRTELAHLATDNLMKQDEPVARASWIRVPKLPGIRDGPVCPRSPRSRCRRYRSYRRSTERIGIAWVDWP